MPLEGVPELCWNCWKTHPGDCREPTIHVADKERLRQKLNVPIPNEAYRQFLRDHTCWNCWKTSEHRTQECPETHRTAIQKEIRRQQLGLPLTRPWKKFMEDRKVTVRPVRKLLEVPKEDGKEDGKKEEEGKEAVAAVEPVLRDGKSTPPHLKRRNKTTETSMMASHDTEDDENNDATDHNKTEKNTKTETSTIPAAIERNLIDFSRKNPQPIASNQNNQTTSNTIVSNIPPSLLDEDTQPMTNLPVLRPTVQPQQQQQEQSDPQQAPPNPGLLIDIDSSNPTPPVNLMQNNLFLQYQNCGYACTQNRSLLKSLNSTVSDVQQSLDTLQPENDNGIGTLEGLCLQLLKQNECVREQLEEIMEEVRGFSLRLDMLESHYEEKATAKGIKTSSLADLLGTPLGRKQFERAKHVISTDNDGNGGVKCPSCENKLKRGALFFHLVKECECPWKGDEEEEEQGGKVH